MDHFTLSVDNQSFTEILVDNWRLPLTDKIRKVVFGELSGEGFLLMLGRLILDRASEVPQAKKFKQFPLFSNQEIVRLTFTEARCSSEIYQGASKKTFPLNSKIVSS